MSTKWTFRREHWPAMLIGVAMCGILVSVGAIAYRFGASSGGQRDLRQAVLHATATHGAENVAVATGRVSEDAEGIFILDFVTGNLQCWVFYPRFQRFGGKFETNISAQFKAIKNAEYLLVTGDSNTTQSAGNARPATCVAYVVDVHSGTFAAYGLPWNRSAEMSGEPQKGMIVCVGGDVYRASSGGASAKRPTPTPTKETGKEKAAPK